MNLLRVGLSSFTCGLCVLVCAWSWDRSLGPAICTVLTMAAVASIIGASVVITLETGR